MSLEKIKGIVGGALLVGTGLGIEYALSKLDLSIEKEYVLSTASNLVGATGALITAGYSMLENKYEKLTN